MAIDNEPQSQDPANDRPRPAASERELLRRITFEPGKMGGRACIRNMRITAGLIVSLVAQGASNEEILHDYPDLEEEDIAASLLFAAWLAREQVYPAT